MSDEITKALEDVLKVVKESREYKECRLLKEKMQENDFIIQLIEKIKTKQKEYVKSNFQSNELKKELNALEEQLNKIPLYLEYNQNLEIINKMIDTINGELNDYFNEKFNILQ